MNSIIIENPLAGVADWTLRRATPDDEPHIRALVRAERLNPTGLDHAAFHVVSFGPMVVGAAQIRRHRDGSNEFASLVVAPAFRGRGIGGALIRTLVAQERQRLHVITTPHGARTYERLGFRRVPGRTAPAAVRRNLRIGQLAGALSRLRGQTPLALWVLERPSRLWLLEEPQAARAALHPFLTRYL